MKTMDLFLEYFCVFSKVLMIGICTIIFVALLSLSIPDSTDPILVQPASALSSVTQITSVKSGGSDVSNGGTATIPAGQKTAKITFSYRGFDDKDHIIEFRCSLDGVNYLKSNCHTQSAENQTAFTGPDGVTRTYNVRTGSVQVELPLPPVPKSYSFGVRVINDNGNISPAATWSFRIKSSEGSGSSSGGPVNSNNPAEQHNSKVTVKFDSITILEDHDGPAYNSHDPETQYIPGQWWLEAYVQGKQVELLDARESTYAGKTIKFKPGTEATVKLAGNIPLSIFTIGDERDCNQFPDLVGEIITNENYEHLEERAKEITDLYSRLYSNPSLDWKDEINALQYKIGGYLIDSGCYDPSNRLGTINLLFSAPDYTSQIAPAPEPHYPSWFPDAFNPKPPHYKSTSRLKDFILKYTITVEN